jgi:hypothetical protein
VRPSLGCAQVEVGGNVYRYSLQRRGAATRREAVVVDLGGPGRALFGSDDHRVFASTWPGREALLFVEEPWVTRPLSSRCAEALEGFLRGLRAAPRKGARASRLVGACGLARAGSWGWTSDQYRLVVERIAEVERVELVGVVATSYGSARTEPLWSLPSVRWLILSSPAWRAVTGSEYLGSRAEGSRAALASTCACDVGRLVTRVRAALARQPVLLATRTPPVEPVDLDAALVGLGYLAPPERERFVAGLSRPVAESAQAIGLLSDATLMRYGEYAMSPAMLAYLDEVCRRYGPWPTEPTSILAALHAPCARLARRQPGRVDAPAAVCVAHGGSDFVTPLRVAREWAALLPGARLVRAQHEGHGARALAAGCAGELGLG